MLESLFQSPAVLAVIEKSNAQDGGQTIDLLQLPAFVFTARTSTAKWNWCWQHGRLNGTQPSNPLPELSVGWGQEHRAGICSGCRAAKGRL